MYSPPIQYAAPAVQAPAWVTLADGWLYYAAGDRPIAAYNRETKQYHVWQAGQWSAAKKAPWEKK